MPREQKIVKAIPIDICLGSPEKRASDLSGRVSSILPDVTFCNWIFFYMGKPLIQILPILCVCKKNRIGWTSVEVENKKKRNVSFCVLWWNVTS